MWRVTPAKTGCKPLQVYKGDTRNPNDLDPQMFEVGPFYLFEFTHTLPFYGLCISAMIE